MAESEPSFTILTPHTDHARSFHTNKFVYPVLSRRSRGISIGINLNPDKVCNFDCIYCQVDRRSTAVTHFVESDRLLRELEHMLDLVSSNELYLDPKFADVPAPLRRLNDIAFSGDGEPTTFANIDAIVADVAAIKDRRRLDRVKLVLITNASMFQRPAVARCLATLDVNQGEIWAKLDAGTEAYYRLVDRTQIPFERILRNLRAAALLRPLVIQSLFMRVEGNGPSPSEIAAFCDRLAEIVASGGMIDRVQVYTVARTPTEEYVSALSPAEVDGIAAQVRSRLRLPVESFYGVSA